MLDGDAGRRYRYCSNLLEFPFVALDQQATSGDELIDISATPVIPLRHGTCREGSRYLAIGAVSVRPAASVAVLRQEEKTKSSDSYAVY